MTATQTAEAQTAETELKQLAERMHTVLETLPAAVVVLDRDGRVSETNSIARAWLRDVAAGESWAAVSARAFEPTLTEHGDLRLKDGRRLVLTQQALGGERGRILLLTDVTSALLYTSNAGRADLDQARRLRLVEKAAACLHDIEKLVNDMLTFAGGRAAIGDEVFRLDELLGRIDDAVRPQCGADQVLSIERCRGGTRIRGNREALAGAVQNLVVNALQSGAGRVGVVARAADADAGEDAGAIDICIDDDGRWSQAAAKDRGPTWTQRDDARPNAPAAPSPSRAADAPGATTAIVDAARSTGAPGYAAPLPLDVGASGHELGMALGHRLIALARNGEHRARIALHPAELGAIEIRISLREEAATVAITAQQPQARELIEASIPRLRELFAHQGLSLADVDVSGHRDGTAGRAPESVPSAVGGATSPLAQLALGADERGLGSPARGSSRLLDVLV